MALPTRSSEEPAIRHRAALLASAPALVGVVAATVVSPTYGIVFAGAALAVATVCFAPHAVLLSVLPAAYLTQRVAGDAVSVADAVLVLASGVSIGLLPRWWHPSCLPPLLAIAFYQSLLLVAVLWNPTPEGVFEWVHRAVLMGGGLVVGFALARMNLPARTVQAYLVVSLGVALAAVAESIFSGFEPAYPLGIAKNLAGGLLAVAFMAALATLRETVLNSLVITALGGGVLATQSRAAMLACAVGAVFIVVRERRVRRALLPFVAVGAALAVFAASTFLGNTDFDPQGSVETRVAYREQAIAYWHEAPLFGQGIRYFTDPRFAFPRPEGGIRHPHNLILEALSEAGVVGLVAVALLLVTALYLTRGSAPFAVAASVAMLATAFMGLFDLYWLAGRTTVPWVLVGLALGLASSATPSDRAVHIPGGNRRFRPSPRH